jgi:hypothetical protein
MLESSPRRRAFSISGLALLAMLVAPSAARAAGGADGHFEQRRSTHFLLREDVAIDRRTGPQGAKRFEHDLLEVLESGYDLLDVTLGLRPRRRIEVEVYDPAIFDQRFAALLPFPAAGFYGGVIRVRGDVQVTEQLTNTLLHEFVHAALDAAAPSQRLPAWLNEGLAEWFAARAAGQPALGRGHRAFLAERAHRGALLPLAVISEPSLVQLAAEDAPLAYLQAAALVDQVTILGGDRALRVLLAQLFRTGDLDRALLRATGVDARGLEASTFAELTRRR